MRKNISNVCKRICALTLAFVMVIGAFPAVVSAEETWTPEVVAFDQTVLAANAKANSEQIEASGSDGGAAWAFDDEAHWWHSRWGGTALDGEVANGNVNENGPIWIQTGFDKVWIVDSITYLPRQDQAYCRINEYTVLIAKMENPTDVPSDTDFVEVKSGALSNTGDRQTIELDADVEATHVRLSVSSVHTNNGTAHVAAQNIGIYGYDLIDVALENKVAECEAVDIADYYHDDQLVMAAALSAAQAVLADEAATEEDMQKVLADLTAAYAVSPAGTHAFNAKVLADNAKANSEQLPIAYDNDGGAAWAFDEEEHWWHSRYQDWEQKAEHEVGSQAGDGKPAETNPIWIQTGFDQKFYVESIEYTSRSNSMGIIKDYEVAVANLDDPAGDPTDDDFEVVKTGTLENVSAAQTIQLDESVEATHVRITAYSAYSEDNGGAGDGHVAAKNIKIYGFDKILADMDAFNAAITAAEELDLTVYIDESTTEFVNAIASAKELLSASNLTQAEADTAVAAIETAKASMELIPESPFVDVPYNHYYFDAVVWAKDNGYVKGITDTAFAPTWNCTRADAVTLLWRIAGTPETALTETEFVDVSADEYYYNAVLWAVENGIVSGTSATTFEPNEICTRAHFVTLLWKYEGSPEAAVDSVSFLDVTSEYYYYDAVCWAAENGIVSGYNSGHFAPHNPCNRGEVVSILYRYYN